LVAPPALAQKSPPQPPATTQQTKPVGAGDKRPVFDLPAEIPANATPLETWAPVEGICKLTFNVNDVGRVVGSSIVADCTSPRLVDPAISTAARWRYDPPVVDGVPRAQSGLHAQVRFRRRE
jgi:hypothetical protein